MKAENILIVEDEPVVALDLQQTLEEMGHQVCAISISMEGAIEAVASHQPSLLLMDIHLQGHGDGIEACHEIYRHWQLPVIFLSAYADEKTVRRAAVAKPFGYLTKPYNKKDLNAVIQVARSRHDAELALAKSEQKLAIAIEAAELATWEWESPLDHLIGDERFKLIWGSSLQPFIASLSAMLARVHPDDRHHVESTLQTQGFFKCDFRAIHDSGEYAYLEMFGHLRINRPDQKLVIGALRDVTPRKKMEERLQQASIVFRTITEGIMVLNTDGLISSVNPAFCKLTGYAEEAALGHYAAEFMVNRRDMEISYADIACTASGFWAGEVGCRRQDGTILHTLLHICTVKDQHGEVLQFVQTFSDISAIREAERQLLHLAYHDPLTGLGNRYLLDQNLESELARALSHQRIVAIMFIDLDGFKAINDSLGHHIGDRVIQEAAGRIVRQIRRHDEAVRLGGDEFVVMIPDVLSSGEGLLVANKILRSLSAPMQIDEQKLVIGASIGVAFFPQDGQTLSDLLSAADSAMYEAKRQGKGRVCAYSSDLVENVRTRLNLEQGMHGALQRNEFVLFYQPVIDLYESRLMGFEALIRWNHPEFGLLPPDKFISIAEDTGLIESIGSWVLDQAAAQIKKWAQQGRQDLFMAVNVSARQFRGNYFLNELKTVLQRHEILPEQIEIEITESMLQDFHSIRKMVLGMRELGVSVAIDDFGTGYSSLALLKYLPVTRIKIDRSFVISLPGTARDVGLFSAIMQMANSLELNVTAEGVETYDQSQILRTMGYPAVQGYFWGRPVAAEDYDEVWIKNSSVSGYFLDENK
ncbi:two-component system response regulator [Iodobacter fluviatilis]|uniref:Bacteriophytochrome cph2 n=1 Tax=Iodobacter fluviatilis TaxID=537 RepID=A0A377Q3G8_9NEIS|nr:EAL domain-containing protein [Iodobacter fluviatilis]TCU90325.1 PAS domain S-box-containing protein/diguanylate cyclase (GGDEF)-like protein [Iodobacter fluviatilis]STQ89352.1 Bacteriophytochrome cph2 [Iodobacter fluviatilis]